MGCIQCHRMRVRASGDWPCREQGEFFPVNDRDLACVPNNDEHSWPRQLERDVRGISASTAMSPILVELQTTESGGKVFLFV
jgi:hypothetical protein